MNRIKGLTNNCIPFFSVRCVQAFFLFTLLICHTARAEDIVYLDPFLDMRAFEGEVELYTPDYESFHVALGSLKSVLEIHLEYPSNKSNGNGNGNGNKSKTSNGNESNKRKEITGWVFYQNNQVSSDLTHKQITIADKTYAIEDSGVRQPIPMEKLTLKRYSRQ
jgi:hypothetical protein